MKPTLTPPWTGKRQPRGEPTAVEAGAGKASNALDGGGCDRQWRDSDRRLAGDGLHARRHGRPGKFYWGFHMIIQAFPSGCGWLEIPGVSQVEKGGKCYWKLNRNVISHLASNQASITDEPKRFYDLYLS